MKIPKKIKVFTETYTVRFVDNISSDDDGFCLGRVDYVDKVILIATKTDKETLIKRDIQEKTFLHELVHAICAEGGYNNISSDEPFVEWMAKNLYNIFPNLKD